MELGFVCSCARFFISSTTRLTFLMLLFRCCFGHLVHLFQSLIYLSSTLRILIRTVTSCMLPLPRATSLVYPMSTFCTLFHTLNSSTLHPYSLNDLKNEAGVAKVVSTPKEQIRETSCRKEEEDTTQKNHRIHEPHQTRHEPFIKAYQS